MPEYTLRIRRYDPQSGEAAHWDEHTVDMPETQSVLDAILQIRDDKDGSIGIRCSCQQAICGSCGVRMNGKPGLACNTHLDEAAARGHGVGWNPPRDGEQREHDHRGRADGQHAGDPGPDRRHGRGALEEDPARHAVADQQGARARARVHRAAREHGRRDADDGLHPVRRLRLGLPGDGGRPAVRRAGGAGQGVPVRRRPAGRRAARAAQGPRPRTSTASTTARTASTASTPAPRASTR